MSFKSIKFSIKYFASILAKLPVAVDFSDPGNSATRLTAAITESRPRPPGEER